MPSVDDIVKFIILLWFAFAFLAGIALSLKNFQNLLYLSSDI